MHRSQWDQLDSLGDRDWWRYRVPRRGSVTVVLSRLPSNYKLWLSRRCSSRIWVSDRAGRRREAIRIRVPEAGVYSVGVLRSRGGSPSFGHYRMNFRFH